MIRKLCVDSFPVCCVIRLSRQLEIAINVFVTSQSYTWFPRTKDSSIDNKQKYGVRGSLATRYVMNLTDRQAS